MRFREGITIRGAFFPGCAWDYPIRYGAPASAHICRIHAEKIRIRTCLGPVNKIKCCFFQDFFLLQAARLLLWRKTKPYTIEYLFDPGFPIGIGGRRRRADEGHPRRVRSVSAPSGGCPDRAYTEIFQSKGLGYVHSREFAEAVRDVAIGASKYSPKEIPATWRDDAENWIGPGSEKLPFHRGDDACNPALVYMASMEYRARPGHEDVTPVFPRNVRAATREARVVAE